jgi:hypothetical protein
LRRCSFYINSKSAKLLNKDDWDRWNQQADQCVVWSRWI